MIDSHCHLQFEKFEGLREDIIDDIENDMDFVVLAGCGPEDNLRALEVSELSDKLGCCMGLHPCSTDHFNDIEQVKQQIINNNVLAVGEVGLDHHHIDDVDVREDQEQVFREMLMLAEELNLPVVVHSREAEKKAFEIVSNYDVKALFHCFNGSVELADKIVSSGHFIGVTGQLLNSSDVENILTSIPVENVLLETDSPYLGDSMPNTPLHTFRIAEKASNVLEIPLDDLKNKFSENASSFYNIYS